MQTFVLAPQSAKKFYVHNDIFRYQDEVYQDNSDSESEDHQPESIKSSSAHGNYYQQANDQVIDADAASGDLNHHHHHLNDHQMVVVDQSTVKGQDVEVKGETLLNGHAPTSGVVESVTAAAAPVVPPQPQRVKDENKENKNAVVDLYTIEANDVATKTTASTNSSAPKEESTKQDSQNNKGKRNDL